MDATETWRHCFHHWPTDLDRRGVIMSSSGEQVPFENFAVSDELLLLERRAPDTMGARMVLLAYADIKLLKIVDVVKMRAFEPLGFAMPPRK